MRTKGLRGVLFLIMHAVVGSGAAAAPISFDRDGSTLPFVVCGTYAMFLTSEMNEGNPPSSLNGDADVFDTVVHVMDLTGFPPADNRMLASAGPLACGSDWFAFGVSESAQNATNFNGDGDTTDVVLHLFNPVSNYQVNLAYAISDVKVSSASGMVAFRVPEGQQGAGSLNPDSDSSDAVLHVWRPICNGGATPGAPCVDNTACVGIPDGTCSGGSCVGGANPGNPCTQDSPDCDGIPNGTCGVVTNIGQAAEDDYVVTGNVVAFRTSEAQQSNTDLNGDFDTNDAVLYVYDASAMSLYTSGRAAERDILLVDVNGDTDGDMAVFRVNEQQQNLGSLNWADGDMKDNVAHLYCLPGAGCTSTGTINLGYATRHFNAAGNWVALGVSEAHDPGVTNGDSDQRDRVVLVHDVSAGTTTSTGFAALGQIEIAGNYIIFAVSERLEGGTDLNQDLDSRDAVIHVWDANTNSSTNTMRAVRRCRAFPTNPPGLLPELPYCFHAQGNTLALLTSERSQNGGAAPAGDLNADLDMRDDIFELWNLAGASLTPTNPNTYGTGSRKHGTNFVFGNNLVAFRIRERNQGQDLNGDGDVRDLVVAAADTSSGNITIMGQGDELFLVTNRTVVFRTTELGGNAVGENQDFNSDGDKGDRVIRYETVP